MDITASASQENQADSEPQSNPDVPSLTTDNSSVTETVPMVVNDPPVEIPAIVVDNTSTVSENEGLMETDETPEIRVTRSAKKGTSFILLVKIFLH